MNSGASDKSPPIQLPAEQVTMADVAAAAGVSKQTVSNVFNSPEKVRPQTRERVERVVAELGFQPNRTAQLLRSNTSGMIGFRIEPVASKTLASSLRDRFLHALVEAGQNADRHLMLFAAADKQQEAATCVNLWRSGSVDGIVLYGIDADDPRPPVLVAAQVPFVCFGRVCDAGTPVPWVDVDNVLGAELVVDHLADTGHRRIGFLGWADGDRVGDDRAQGWVKAMDRHGILAASHRLDVRGEDTWTCGARMARELLSRPDPPSALVAVSSTLAAGALYAVRDAGLAPGKDVALAGYDDTPSAEVLDLTSVRQPVGAVAAEILAALFRSREQAAPVAALLAPELIIRGSTS